ncbi:hypothetical protein BH09PSE2_BH09PSE2_00220 [soil metagenome]
MISSRRRLLSLGLGCAATAAAAPTAGLAHGRVLSPVLGKLPELGHKARQAFLHNTHTGESLKAVYWENGKYVPQALSSLMKVLRDWRNGEEHMMDPRVFDLLHTVSTKVESNQPIQIISGYRSAATNAAMHEKSSQVASNSFHTKGMATDIRIPGVDLRHLHKAALSLKAGGVGFYPVSNFVHVDVGPLRTWQGA